MVRKNYTRWLVALLVLGVTTCALLFFAPGGIAKKTTCVSIQNGTLFASTGELITPGYDEFGYNYQAHMFNGRYCDYDRVSGGDYCDVTLVMKWNDAWLSNKDCDGDGKLDRHYGFGSYIGSGAWETNHQSGTYIGDDGKEHKWTYFVKIVAKPTADYDCAAHGGEEIWGTFCIIQSVFNDPYGGYHGLEFKAARPGLGNW
jgi:hypothetical protein